MPVDTPAPDRYALIGQPVGHSRSPLIHQLFARQTQQSLTYELIEASQEEFADAVRSFRDEGGRGMNVTVPHKEAAFELCDAVGAEAEAAQAVNTLSFGDDGIHGDNTDGLGLVRDLVSNQQRAIADRRVLILGAGGAARGIIGPLLEEKPHALVVANRTPKRAEQIAMLFARRKPLEVCGFDELESLGDFDVVINATSAGLRGEQPPFPASLLGPETLAYDLAYSLKPTPFVEWAARNGAGEALQGWGMLVEQAAESFLIWRGVMPKTEPILSQLRKLTSH